MMVFKAIMLIVMQTSWLPAFFLKKRKFVDNLLKPHSVQAK